ncbi:wax ester/triacylglycerol synthase domain-containing protein [Rhodococcus sp. SORGH_AS_0303]|uniref:wax ester/triacylglycerol synthase domain-containing protein n=1 Tax=Rhodococcus sp. SORGH_AS_0303 TaxID=3041753 RepID=UPI002788E10D|nr:wax ester/triacylglycerol synthase domain-containing protein [Rhodococcus sp. SORGH_AS_0303]MDQ1200264.1 diacylglycerol O-acyltransferase [Rhodococcus sp. SORGH_AS_0303]
MTSRDALNLYLESPHTSAILIHAFVVDVAAGPGTGLRTHADAVAYARSIVHLDPIFRQRLHRYPGDIHYPFWVDDPDADVDSHVTVTHQQDGDVEIVRRRTVELSREFFDFTTGPAWQLHFLVDLHGVDGVPDGGTVMIAKFHHSAIDGVSASDLISRMLSPTPAEPRPETAEVPVPGRVRALSRVPADLVRLAAVAVRWSTRSRAGTPPASSTAPTAVPATRFNGDKEPDMSWDLAWLDLDRIRRVKSAYPGMTVNDMLTAIISLALSTYLEERGELPAGSLSISMPMSTRSLTDATTANQLTPMMVDLHTDVPDPAERLRRIHESLVAAKESVARSTERTGPPHPLGALPSVVVPVIGALTRAPSTDPATAPVTTMLSNVSYGRGPLALLGAPVVGCYGVLPAVRGVHLTHSARSVGTSISLSVAANAQSLPDIEHYMDVVRHALDLLDPDVDTTRA